MAVETFADARVTVDVTELCSKYAVPHALVIHQQEQQQQQQQLSTESQQRLQAFTATDSSVVQYWTDKLSTGNPVKQPSVSTFLICLQTSNAQHAT
jgi:hypothetical protein